jgi:hypothetical protein
MRERRAVPEAAALFERLLDVRVGIEDALAAKQTDGVVEVSARSDRRVDLEAVFETGEEIVRAVSRRRVDRARAGVEGDVLGEHTNRVALVKRMAEADPVELRAFQSRDRRLERPPDDLRHHRRELFGEQYCSAVDVVRGVVEIGMKRDREIGRNRPWRGRPDEHRHVPAGKLRDTRGQFPRARLGERKLDVDRRRGMILVFDLRLGQRRAAMNAPVDRLLPLGYQSLFHELAERPGDRRLIPEVHRQVRLVPRAEDAEPLELLRHRADEALGVRTARAAEVGHRHLALLGSELAVHLELDRQAVAVVADDVRRVEPGHRTRLDDQILEDLVHRRAHVDVAVGVRRTVVQHELRRALAARANLPIETLGGPARERVGFARLQARLHRKVGTRQVDGVFPLGHGYPSIL